MKVASFLKKVQNDTLNTTTERLHSTVWRKQLISSDSLFKSLHEREFSKNFKSQHQILRKPTCTKVSHGNATRLVFVKIQVKSKSKVLKKIMSPTTVVSIIMKKLLLERNSK